jgi:hypothetical protein
MRNIVFGAAVLTITVPRYERQEQGTALRTPRAQGVGPEAFGAGLAQGVQQAGGEAAKFYQKEADEQDATRANTANTAYDKWEVENVHTKLNEPEYIGENSIGLAPKLSEARTKFVTEYESTLGNERQKQLFRSHVEKNEPKFLLTVNGHEQKEGQKVKIKSADAAVETIKGNIAALTSLPELDEAVYGDQVAKLMEKIKIRGAFEGYGANSEVVNTMMAGALSEVTTGRVKALLDQDRDEEAVAYFEQTQVDLTAKHRDALLPVVEKVKQLNTAKAEAQTIWAKYQPQSINDGLDLDAMRAEIQAGKGTDEAKELTEKRVEQLASDYSRQKQQMEQGAANRIYGLAIKNGKGYPEVTKSIHAADDLDNDAKRNLLSWADSHFRISEGRSEAKQDSKRALELAQLGKFLQFQGEYVRGDHGNLTPEQLATKAAELGGYTDNAMQFVQNVNDNLQQIKIDQGDFTDTIRLLRQNEQYAKLLPATEKQSDVDKAKMALLQGKVVELMSLSRKADPRKGLSVQGAILQAMQDVQIKEKWNFLGMSGGGSSAPLYTLQSELPDEYAQDASKWPKASQDQVIDTIWKARNPNKAMTPQQRETYRAELLKG